MQVNFYKYQGTGNDFIMLDNRKEVYSRLSKAQVKKLCDRRFGIGADGLILLNEKKGFDFEMAYFNADGNPGSMCGNGGRCIVQFAIDSGIHKSSYRFYAVDGEHEAELDGNCIRLKMKDVSAVEIHGAYAVIDTGSPHYIKFSSDVREIEVKEKGAEIRYSKQFKEKGINVNFTEATGNDSIFVRTYERGVEDETLSCGTGVTAAALVYAHNDKGFNNVKVQTPGGSLNVEFNKINDQTFSDIRLCGPAECVFKGSIEIH